MLPRPIQRNLLFLGMVLVVALLPLVGGLHHHHDGESRGACWFCTTALTATVPLLVQLGVAALVRGVPSEANSSTLARFAWAVQHRRGPPFFSRA